MQIKGTRVTKHIALLDGDIDDDEDAEDADSHYSVHHSLIISDDNNFAEFPGKKRLIGKSSWWIVKRN